MLGEIMENLNLHENKNKNSLFESGKTIQSIIESERDKNTERYEHFADDKSSYNFKKEIEKIIEREEIKDPTIEIKKIIADGGNYLGDLYTADVRGVKNSEEIEINLFIKKQLPILVDAISIEGAYTRETFVYNKLFKIYEEFQNDANLLEKSRLNFPKFYDTDDIATIIMDNMYKRGFKVFPRRKCITIEFAKLAIDQLAIMHSLSFVLEAKIPKYFEKLKKELKTIVSVNGENYLKFLKNQCKTVLSILKSDEAKRRFNDKFCEKVPEFPKYYDGRFTGTKCICHGDFRVNNMMCKINNDGIMSEIVVLDFQTVFYGAPLTDFFYFLFGATDKNFRAKHMIYLKEYYYKKLSEFLHTFKLDIKDIYPREIFDKDYKELIIDAGLIMSIMAIGFILAPDDDFPDLAKLTVEELNPKVTVVYEERVNDLIQDVIDWGFL